MSLDKAIKHGKEKRQQYRKRTSKSVSNSCRNHGGCPRCVNSRLRKYRAHEQDARDQISEYEHGTISEC